MSSVVLANSANRKVWSFRSALARLHAVREPCDQHIRQIGHRHLPLGQGNIVRDAVGGQGSQVGIENRIGGAWIAVARLTDAAGVDQIAARQKIDG